MKNTKAIVSLADDKYFSLLIELITSIKKFPESKDVAICILDAGLSNDNKKLLKPLVNEIKKAEWDISVPDYKIKGREWLKSQISRAFLPKYFPEYEKYLWLDSDTWINNWEAVEMFYKGCENNKLAIVQSIAPGYKDVGRVNWIFRNLASVKTQNYKHAKNSGFSDKIARKIAFAPHLNHVEMQAKAEEFYSAYDEGFGGCNRYEHAWGPELAFYATCGFESYADFAAGVNKVMKIFEGRLATANLNILNHRDDILVKVMD